MMPVPAQIRGVVGDHHDVKDPARDGLVASRAQVCLPRRVRLDGRDGHPEKIAHAKTKAIATSATITITMSATSLSFSRKGLNPMIQR